MLLVMREACVSRVGVRVKLEGLDLNEFANKYIEALGQQHGQDITNRRLCPEQSRCSYHAPKEDIKCVLEDPVTAE